jgi:hypothetical protein
MKYLMLALQSFLLLLGTVTVAMAEEGPVAYQSTAYVWYAVIAFFVIWGIYDSFFRPIH